MESIQDLVILLRQPDVPRPSAQIKQLTSEFAPQDSELRSQLASSSSEEGSDLASELATGLFRLAARSIPRNAESSSRKIDALPEDIEISTFALRLARNIVAGCQDLQDIFWRRIEILDPVLSFITAFAQVHDEIYRPLTRAAVQLLSNLLMANEKVQAAFWARYVDKGSAELGETQLILRLLASSDHGTLVATMLILLTCCRASHERSRQLATSSVCRPVLEMLLSILEQSFRDFAEATHDASSSPIEELDELSSMTYSLFSHLFARQLFGPMLINVTPATSQDGDEEFVPHNPVNASQRTLLGLFDAYIYAGAEDYGSSLQTESSQDFTDADALISTFVRLGTHLRSAMTQLPRQASPGSGSSEGAVSSNPSFDARTLIGVPQAIVLLVQCMSEWMVLSSKRLDEAKEEGISSTDLKEPAVLAGCYLLDRKRQLAKEGLRSVDLDSADPLANQDLDPDDPIGVAISLLREAAAVFPAESPFKNSNPQNAAPSSTIPTEAPEGHVLSHTGTSSLLAQSSAAAASQLENAGGPGKIAFAYLKRELVRFVGIVSFVEARGASNADKAGVRDVQDYVRAMGGLYVVLGLTQLDELNPYIREHAVFAMRNLLAGNQASQDMIARLRKVDDP
ncbi:unnamed protein product [Tilletia laevis]|uniref:Ataxin-10 homolog n=2 Tax=Tilletia TaxID=13289 RepID=A0A177VHG1_9BASI|nr:hypothetical protein CF336_g305 [Tilletia laevis]KAE8265302.1 hypothetical protein A4X03_0g350 [Tilletia caries]KAE8208806.1 hypothetical protein CF335_g131 [Tilletia laevis]CAD6890726.1 unnamed protein product [Tilletia caries]CAD6909631.1 unnamed protein product [Tilletia laevis]